LLLTKEGRYDSVVTTSQSSVDPYGATLRRAVKSLTMKSRITAPMKAPTMPVPCTTRPASQPEIPPTTSRANTVRNSARPCSPGCGEKRPYRGTTCRCLRLISVPGAGVPLATATVSFPQHACIGCPCQLRQRSAGAIARVSLLLCGRTALLL